MSIHQYKTDLERYLKIAEESILRADRFSKAKEESLNRCKDLHKLFRFDIAESRKYELVLIYKEHLQKVKPTGMLGEYLLKFILEVAQHETGIERLSKTKATEIVNSIAI